MKLRIKGNSLRMRLMKNEVDELTQNGNIEELIDFGASKLVYQLTLSNERPMIDAEFLDDIIRVFIPAELGMTWANTDQVSLRQVKQLADNKELSLLIEKDFKCLTDRPGEDESQAYPNPLAHIGHTHS